LLPAGDYERKWRAWNLPSPGRVARRRFIGSLKCADGFVSLSLVNYATTKDAPILNRKKNIRRIDHETARKEADTWLSGPLFSAAIVW